VERYNPDVVVFCEIRRGPDDTESHFDARIGTTLTGSATYEGVRVKLRTIGDGTVPSYSSTVYGRMRSYPAVVGAEHGVMCNRGEVVDLVKKALA
jgi:hypothetical protein